MISSPSFLQPTHCATLPTAESSISDVSESASHTGVEDKISQPSARLFISPHTLQCPVERHLYPVWLLGHLPMVVPSPKVPVPQKLRNKDTVSYRYCEMEDSGYISIVFSQSKEIFTIFFTGNALSNRGLCRVFNICCRGVSVTNRS